MEEQKEKEKGVGCVQCAQPTPFGAEREVSELNSVTPCIVTFYTFQTFLCSHIVATREYLERTHRYRC